MAPCQEPWTSARQRPTWAPPKAPTGPFPARLPLAQVNPGQQVLDIQPKLISHAIRIAAFNAAATLARDARVHTGHARANHQAHNLVRQGLTSSAGIDPSDGVLTIRLDRLPTQCATNGCR